MCDPEKHVHVVYGVLPGSGAVTFYLDKLVDKDMGSASVTCACGVLKVGVYNLSEERRLIADKAKEDVTGSLNRRIKA